MLHTRRDFLQHASLFVAASAIGVRQVWGADAIADTTLGRVRGVEAGGIRVFKGIPYGAATSGRNRFMPAVDPPKWAGVRDALAYGHSAPQREPDNAGGEGRLAVAAAGLPPEGEDCLVLNVWTPALEGRRPVMVWCHGGGFATGSGSSPGTDGTNLARYGDVVIVSINHRLNVLGFTFLGDIAGAEFAQSGDAGVLDIVHALKWVRANIAQFGGDPNNVTVFGQSGGGRKVATLLAMPSARGLFHRAVIESGATMRLVEPAQATRVATELLNALGISRARVGNLQTVPLNRLMTAYFAVVRRMNVDQMTMGFSPTMDGSVVTHHPFHPAASDVSPAVPVLLGSTRTELTSSASEAAFTLTEDAMRGRVRDLIGAASSERVIDVYRRANPGATASDIWFLIASDHRYNGPVMKIAERRAALNGGPVFLYYFRWESPLEGGRLKSPHTIEIPFVFRNTATSRLTMNSPQAPALADKVSDAWLAFARAGDPNTPRLPKWPAFEAANRATMVFDNTCAAVNDPIREQRLAIFNVLGLTS